MRARRRFRVGSLIAALALGLLMGYSWPYLTDTLSLGPSTTLHTYKLHEAEGVWWSILETETRSDVAVQAGAHDTEEAARQALESLARYFSSPIASQSAAQAAASPIRASPPGWCRIALASPTDEELWRIKQPRLSSTSSLYHEYDVYYRGVAYGWPMRSWAYHVVKRGQTWTSFGALDTTNRSWPFSPVFPGVIINTLLFALPWYALFFGIGAARRWNRCRRGLCPRCAYDLAGNTTGVCPECGASSPQRGAGESETPSVTLEDLRDTSPAGAGEDAEPPDPGNP